MTDSRRKLFLVVAMLALVAPPGLLCAQNGRKQKNFKDRGEYNLLQGAIKETDPNRKLQFLNEWKARYPNSDFKDLRDQLFLAAYVPLNRAQDAVNAAKDMLANDPKNFSALFYTTLLAPRIAPVGAENIDMAQRAAYALLVNLDTKPAAISDAQWPTVRKTAEATAHLTLGWAAEQQKNYDTAESEYTKSLQIDPNASQVSYRLGEVIVAQKKPEKESAALYEFARAAAYDGPGALNPTGRTEVQNYLEETYITYHGDKDGLDQLLAQSKASALPPVAFNIPHKAPDNLVQIRNSSGKNAAVILVGPSAQVFQIRAAQEVTIKVFAGQYSILVRYGDPGRYVFSKSGPFAVTETATEHSNVKITLRGVPNNGK